MEKFGIIKETKINFDKLNLKTDLKSVIKKASKKDYNIYMRNLKLRKGGLLDRILRKDLRKNKVYSLLLMFIGYLSIHIDGDCTVFILTLMLGLPVFFSNENVITD